MGRYSKYQNTDNWFGTIPATWETHRIKRLFALRDKRNFLPLEQVNLISLYSNVGVRQHCDIEHTTGNRARNADGYKVVHKDDIIVNILLCWMGAIGRSNYDGVTSPAYDVYMPRTNINSQYYHYLFRTKAFSGECYKVGKGIMAMRWRTYSPQFMNINVPVPPRAEQDQIVRFLDWKVSEIDKLIGIRRKEIQELEKLKAEIINSAILQGIDSNVVMKKTDVYYLPKIPATWKVIKIKRICKVGASISNQLKKHTDQDKVVFLPMENISENGKIDCSIKQPIAKVRTGFSSFAKNDVIVAKITPCFENGKGACLDELKSDIGYGTTELFNLRAGNDVLPKYLYYITMTKIFRSLGEGQMTGSAGQKRVPADFIRNFVIGLPSIAIQYKIIDYICLKTSQINRLICTKHKQLEFLKELCSTIISDVVTGKIDVRNIPVPAYEHVDDMVADDGEGNDEETGIPGEED